MSRIVIALGGNAIEKGEAVSTAESQIQACKETAQKLYSLIADGHEIILSHGNGPQVGNLLLQQEGNQYQDKVAPFPLDTLVGMSEGMIGYWLQQAIFNEFAKNDLKKSVSTLVTQVVVDQNDPAFGNPTKYVGPFYQEAEAKSLVAEKGWQIKEDKGRGYRRVVPSPKPEDIVEKDMMMELLKSGHLVIAAGGGGVPVIKKNGMLEGVEAVIDKDFTSEKVADIMNADTLYILTGVETVYLNFGAPNQQELRHVSADEMQGYVEENHFAPGSMLPKVEACIKFVKSKPGRKAIITSLEKVHEAFADQTGTHIS